MSRTAPILLLAFVATMAGAQIPPRTISAPKNEVSDEFLAYLHGLIYKNLELQIDGVTLKERFPEFDTPRHSPFDDITVMSRLHEVDRSDRRVVLITLEFSVPLQHTVEAVNFLGIRPVQLLGSQRIVAKEERIRPGAGAFADLADFSGVRSLTVLTIVEGFMRVDFADWLDFILGPFVDDVQVKLIAIGRYEGIWYGIMGGVNDAGTPKTGVIDLSTSKFLLQPPALLSQLAVELVKGEIE